MSDVLVDFVIFDTVNFPGSAGLPIINEAPAEFPEDFPAIYGNVDFAFSVAFSLTDTESGMPLTITDIEVLEAPEFVNHQVLSVNTVRISVKPDVVVFPGEIFELLIDDQEILTGSIDLVSNTNIIEGVGTKFTEELEIGNDIVIVNTSERFTISNIISDTVLETEQEIEEDTLGSRFSIGNISEITVNETISPGDYKTIFQWLDPPIKELERSYTFAITYIGDLGTQVINTVHIQVFFWHYIPSLQKFDSLIEGSEY